MDTAEAFSRNKIDVITPILPADQNIYASPKTNISLSGAFSLASKNDNPVVQQPAPTPAVNAQNDNLAVQAVHIAGDSLRGIEGARYNPNETGMGTAMRQISQTAKETVAAIGNIFGGGGNDNDNQEPAMQPQPVQPRPQQPTPFGFA